MTYFIILVFNICYQVSGQDIIKIIPGHSINFNNHEIKLKETSLDSLLFHLELKDTFGIILSHWDGIDLETGEETYGFEVIKEIPFEGIVFNFSGPSEDSLSLASIRIDKNLERIEIAPCPVYFDNADKQIDECFPLQNKLDYISADFLTYNLYSYGISFSLDSIGNTRILEEVTIHHTLN